MTKVLAGMIFVWQIEGLGWDPQSWNLKILVVTMTSQGAIYSPILNLIVFDKDFG